METFDLITEELKTNIKNLSTSELVRMKNEIQHDLAIPNAVNARARSAALANKRLLTQALMTREGKDPHEVQNEHGHIAPGTTPEQLKAMDVKHAANQKKFDATAAEARQPRLKAAYEHELKSNIDLGWEPAKAEARAAKSTGYDPGDNGSGD